MPSSFEFSDDPWHAPGVSVHHAAAGPAAGGSGTEALCGFHHFAVAAVLSGGAGIRATMPAFLLSLFHQFDGLAYPLSPEFSWLARPEVCMMLGLFLVVEILADQIPAVDHALHAVLVPAHPVAGGALAMAPAFCGGALAKVPMALAGASLAGTVHLQKTVFRASLSGTSAGCLNPIVSNCESVIATIAVVMSLLNPGVAGVVALIMILVGACGVYAVVSLCRGASADDGKPPPPHLPGLGDYGYNHPGYNNRPMAPDPQQAFLGVPPSAPPMAAIPSQPDGDAGPSDAELRRLLAHAEAEERAFGSNSPAIAGPPVTTTDQQRAEAAFEVERVLASPSLTAVLGGGSVHQRRQEFRRLLRLLHPDKGLAFGPRAAAALHRVVEANTVCNSGEP